MTGESQPLFPTSSWLAALAAQVPWIGDPALLHRYRAPNATLIAEGDARPRAVFIGDSLIEGWRDLESLAPAGWRYVNRGVSGQTSAQILTRFQHDAMALDPALVVILAGSNDLRAFFGPPAVAGPSAVARVARNITAMADIARGRGVCVAIGAVPPVAPDFPRARPSAARRDPAAIRAVNGWLAHFAADRGHPFLDFHGALADANGAFDHALTRDGVHPNAAGYRAMAASVARVVAQFAASPPSAA